MPDQFEVPVSEQEKPEEKKRGLSFSEAYDQMVAEVREDYLNRAKTTSKWFSHDFLISGKGRDAKVVDLFAEEEVPETEKVKSWNIQFLRDELIKLTGPDVLEDQAKRIAGVLDRVVSQFPDRIPRYFQGYTKCASFPDSTLERFQEETEPLILFALELDKKGEAIPSKIKDLKTLYAKSVRVEV